MADHSTLRILQPNVSTDPIFVRWLKQQLQHASPLDHDDCRTVSIVRGNEIAAVVAFHGWTAHTVEASIASDGTKSWATRGYVQAVYEYAFVTADKARLNFTVSVSNEAAIRMHKTLGHRLDCVLHDAEGEGNDLYLFSLTRRDWRAGRFCRSKTPMNKYGSKQGTNACSGSTTS